MSDDAVVRVQPGELRKPGYCMIKGAPCRITEIEQVKLATANGNKKLRLTGVHVFTGKKFDDTINLTAGFHGIEVPVTSKSRYALLDVDASSGDLSLLNDDGTTKEDVSLTRDETGKEWDEIGAELVRRFDEGEALQVTVLSIMSRDILVEVAKESDS